MSFWSFAASHLKDSALIFFFFVYFLSSVISQNKNKMILLLQLYGKKKFCAARLSARGLLGKVTKYKWTRKNMVFRFSDQFNKSTNSKTSRKLLIEQTIQLMDWLLLYLLKISIKQLVLLMQWKLVQYGTCVNLLT